MPTRIFSTAEFDRFARKERIEDAVLIETVERVERGLVDADLGGGLLKLRVARPGQGRSSGYRTIVACVVWERAFYLLGFGKNDMNNVGEVAVRNLRKNGQALQSLTEEELTSLMRGGHLREIER